MNSIENTICSNHFKKNGFLVIIDMILNLQIYFTIQNKMHINLCWPLRVFFFFFINIALEVNFLLNWASIGVVIFVCFHAFISRCTLYLLNSFRSWFVNENLHILFYGLSKIIPVTCISLISRQWTFLTLVFFFQSKPLAIWNLYIYVWTKFVKWIDISKS